VQKATLRIQFFLHICYHIFKGGKMSSAEESESEQCIEGFTETFGQL